MARSVSYCCIVDINGIKFSTTSVNFDHLVVHQNDFDTIIYDDSINATIECGCDIVGRRQRKTDEECCSKAVLANSW